MSRADSSSPQSANNAPEALLAQVALGNRAAFEVLYRNTSGRLFGICLHVLQIRADAEDALQEAYASVWKTAVSYDSGRASAMSWLGTIARNKAIDRLRALPNRRDLSPLESSQELVDPQISPLQQTEASSEAERLARCLEELEPRRRSLVREAFFGGFTYEELATRAQAPLGSIKSWIRRSLIQLKACLGP